MSDGTTDAIAHINTKAERRFRLQVMVDKLREDMKVDSEILQAKYLTQMEPLVAEIEVLDNELWDEIDGNRSSLIAKGKQSFVTLVAKFQFKRASDTDKVKSGSQNIKGVMDVARKLGVVRKIATPVREYKLDRRKFAAWLKKNPELREQFEQFLEPREDETLGMQPNSGYTVFHDSKRVSPPSISIKKSMPR